MLKSGKISQGDGENMEKQEVEIFSKKTGFQNGGKGEC